MTQMPDRNTLVRSLHDLGLAAWFGGSLAAAVAVNGAAADVPTRRYGCGPPTQAGPAGPRSTPPPSPRTSSATPGCCQPRPCYHAGRVGASTVASPVQTGAALAVTVYSRALGKKLQHADGVPVQGGTDPAATTPPEPASAQQQLGTCQWLIPTLTGGISVPSALQGEQQRPTQQLSRILTRPGRWLRAAA
jgi:hypothetical protein